VCIPCLDSHSTKCKNCKGNGHYMEEVKPSYSAHFVVTSLFKYIGDSKELPDTCGYGDTVAVFEDYLHLAYAVKSYWDKKETDTNQLMKKARGI
jgi:hypothetical protein